MPERPRSEHVTVLKNEAITWLGCREGGVYVDCTVGGGGHAAAILDATGPQGRLIGLDQDEVALSAARERLADAIRAERVALVHNNFERLGEALAEQGLSAVDGILFDLGVSSFQLDEGERGFSYQQDAPLDMRMDRMAVTTAADLVNTASQEELAHVIRAYGEEKWASRIASFIVDRRSRERIYTTGQLVEIIKAAIPAAARREGPHPAKRTFQALRIAVNDELGVLARTLDVAIRYLAPGGRVVVISFHSLEDRRVKDAFAAAAKGCVCPPDFPVCVCGKTPTVRVLTRKPVVPSGDELAANPRARSARLRAAERLPRRGAV